MADGVLSIVADRALGWLATAVADELGLLLGVKKEFEGLQNTLGAIAAVLRVSEKKNQAHDPRVKLCLQRLEAAMDEADVWMDQRSYEYLRRQVMPGNNKMIFKEVLTFFSSSIQLVFRHKMASRIRDLKKKLDKIEDDTKHFHFDALPPQEETNVVGIERDTHSFVNEKSVIGRNEEKEALIELLLDTKNGIEVDVSVLPIVGAGGLGKTTLVKMIFNDSTVQEYFDLKMWVCVSDDFDVKLIVGKIIESATKSKSPANLSFELLRYNLHKEINGKRYFLVLDDVWNEEPEKWQTLKELLEVGAHGSMIVLTTRNQKVAKVTSTGETFHLGILDEEKSWSLFREMAFEGGQEPGNPSVVETGKKITRKCGGLPLAIKAIGRMLYYKNKNQEMEWLSLVDKELLEIISHDQDDDIILPTLKLSYDHLPAILKQCFTCCSLFPKDYEITVDTLIKLWMAQGFIKSTDPKECLEEVGHKYFMELYGRSFFQEVKRDEDFGDITSCKMHDLMHDLATSLAEKKCMTLDLSKQSSIDGEARHLSFDFRLYSPTEIPASWIQAKRLRSILLIHDYWYELKQLEESFYKDIVLNFKSLRSLDLHALSIERVPKSMGDLRFLRYLDLSDNDKIQELPNSVTRLLHLQTLKLNGCWRLKELPRDIKRLVNLRHLEIWGCHNLTHMPRGLGQLTNLQTLSRFVLRRDASSAELSEVAALINLRGELQVRNLEGGVNAEDANLKDKKGITYLVLHWDDINHDGGDVADFDHVKTLEGFQLSCWGGNLKRLRLESYMGLGFPSNWLPSSFSKLVVFELFFCNNCQRLPPLDQFPSLKNLRLEYVDGLEHIIENGGDSLIIMPSLRELYLIGLPNLKSWWRKDDWLALKMFPSFPALLQLWIWDCPQLNSMPLYPYVEDVTLVNGSLKPLEETVLMESSYASSSSSSPFSPLSNLRNLTLWRHENVESVPDNLLKSLTSLKYLEVHDCPKLKKLQIHHLTSLQSLTIWGCEELIDILNDVDDEDAWRGLRTLTLRSLKKLVGLPEGLQHVTSLQTLSLDECESLMGIPEWIGNCNSLRVLRIVGCPNLTTLPHAISNLNSLHTLRIRDNPILLERCKRETGEDWHKIEHIPELDLEGIEEHSRTEVNSQEETVPKPINNFRLPKLCFN